MSDEASVSSSNFTERTQVSIVPWYNTAQFKKVFEYLYSDDVSDKKWAYDTITVWNTRCRESLPAAIEASYLLVSAIIQDTLWTNDASLSHYSDMQANYSLAIIRFVNLIVEVHQNFPCKRPIASICKELGIPSEIVRLRNECTHSQRPSLSVLRKAAQDALDYLKKSYWEKEASTMNDHIKRLTTDDSRIQRLLRRYMAIKLEDKNEKELNCILGAIGGVVKKNKYLFIEVLTSDGYFIPDIEDFKIMVYSARDFSEFMSEMDEDKINDKMFTDSSAVAMYLLPEIPNTHEKLWTPVILELNRCDAVPLFMEALLASQGSRTIVGQKLIILWILKILKIHLDHKNVEACPLKKVFSRKGMVVNWRSMFLSAIRKPCKYTPVLLPLLLSKLDFRKDFTLHMINMLAIYLGQVKEGAIQPPLKQRIFTVDDLKLAKRQQKLEILKASGIPTESIFSVCSDETHKFWPIGCILNALYDDEESEDESEDDDTENFDDEMSNRRCLPLSHGNDNEDVENMDIPDETFPTLEEIRHLLEIKNL